MCRVTEIQHSDLVCVRNAETSLDEFLRSTFFINHMEKKCTSSLSKRETSTSHPKYEINYRMNKPYLKIHPLTMHL